MARLNIYAEIEEVRSRVALQNWSAVSHDVENRLYRLKNLIGTDETNELHRHVIVSSIAALETFHRGTIIAIIEAGDAYRQRAADGIQEKFSMSDALKWMTSKSASFAELVAHSSKLSSLEVILSNFSRLLCIDVKSSLQNVTSPMDRRKHPEERRSIVEDTDDLLKNISEGYRLRHIFAHEAASSIEIDKFKCAQINSAASIWVEAIDAMLWETIYIDQPITTHEMITHASLELKKARGLLAKAMTSALRNTRGSNTRRWLRHNHFQWMASIQDWVDGSYGSMPGTMWRPISISERASAIGARAQMINKWNSDSNQDI